MSFKGARQNSLTGPSLLDKPKPQMRGPTPENDAAVASSDDDHDRPSAVPRPPTQGHPFSGRRPSQSWLQDIQPRKFSLPTENLPVNNDNAFKNTGSTVAWNTTSFTSQNTNAQSRLKEVVPSPTTVLPGTDKGLPSPTNREADDGIGFLLNQGPTRKAVRSQSYSVGQQETDHTLPAQLASRNRLSNRPSRPSLLGNDSALGLLREDDADEESSNGSEGAGVRLPPGYWEQQHKQTTGALLKQAAVENARSRTRATSTSSPVSQYQRKPHTMRGLPRTENDSAIDEIEELEAAAAHLHKLSLTRRFSETVGNVQRESVVDYDLDQIKRQHWASSNTFGPGIDPLSRRHSFATVGAHHNPYTLSTLSNTYEEDEGPGESTQTMRSPMTTDQFDPTSYFTGYGPVSRAVNVSEVSSAHPAPMMDATSGPNNPYAVPAVVGRPGKRLYIVAFKCSRADIYYVYDNTGLQINAGDLVIVEGDRGQDLGYVTHVNVTPEEAKRLKAEAQQEHFRWLVYFSKLSLSGSHNENGMLGALFRAQGAAAGRDPVVPALAYGAQPEQESKPKMIKRLAGDHEVARLKEKEGQEAKAKRIGAQKAAEHHLPMEILDAEYQMDNHKLTYFYYADSYVNFNDLVTDLFKQYKVRIWMSAVNPASVVNPAGIMQLPPPSAIGPGAIIHRNQSANASLPVGPGFGNPAYRNEQYSRVGAAIGQTYDEGFYSPFSQQLPGYPGQPQAGYGMQWNQSNQPGPDPFNRYNPYPVAATSYSNASASGTPVNYGAYYPPPLSSSPAYQGPAGNAGSYGAAAYSGAPQAPGYGAHANAHNGLPPVTTGFVSHANSHNGLPQVTAGFVPHASSHNGPPPTTSGPYAAPMYSNGNKGAHANYDDILRKTLNMHLNK